MFKSLAAGLVAAALLAAPVIGSVAVSPAAAATVIKTKTVKTKPSTMKMVRIHRHHARNLRHVHVVAAPVRHTRLHAGMRGHRVIGYRAASVRHVNASVRNHPRHGIKAVKVNKQVKQIKQEKAGRAG